MEKQQIDMVSSEFIPNSLYILVKPASAVEKTTAGGIIVPLTKKRNTFDRATSGVAIAVGEEVENIKTGNYVIWPSTDGLDLEFDDGEFILVRQASIIGFKK